MVFILYPSIRLFRKHCLVPTICQPLCQALGIERWTNFYSSSKMLLMPLFSPTPTGLQLFQTEPPVSQHLSFPMPITWFWIWSGIVFKEGLYQPLVWVEMWQEMALSSQERRIWADTDLDGRWSEAPEKNEEWDLQIKAAAWLLTAASSLCLGSARPLPSPFHGPWRVKPKPLPSCPVSQVMGLQLMAIWTRLVN